MEKGARGQWKGGQERFASKRGYQNKMRGKHGNIKGVTGR